MNQKKHPFFILLKNIVGLFQNMLGYKNQEELKKQENQRKLRNLQKQQNELENKELSYQLAKRKGQINAEKMMKDLIILELSNKLALIMKKHDNSKSISEQKLIMKNLQKYKKNSKNVSILCVMNEK